jgi:hypothetical protein
MNIKYISLFLVLGIAGLNAIPNIKNVLTGLNDTTSLRNALTMEEYIGYLYARQHVVACYSSLTEPVFGCDEYEQYERDFEKAKNELLRRYDARKAFNYENAEKIEAIRALIDKDANEVILLKVVGTLKKLKVSIYG